LAERPVAAPKAERPASKGWAGCCALHAAPS